MEHKERNKHEFERLEKTKRTTGLKLEEKRRHMELVTAMGGARTDAVYYICLETQQPCDPGDPPEGCTCRQQVY